MRIYDQNTGILERVVCNKCGRELQVENGFLREGVAPVTVTWDYFSDKDTQCHTFDLCEACYDALTDTFEIKPEVSVKTEL